MIDPMITTALTRQTKASMRSVFSARLMDHKVPKD